MQLQLYGIFLTQDIVTFNIQTDEGECNNQVKKSNAMEMKKMQSRILNNTDLFTWIRQNPYKYIRENRANQKLPRNPMVLFRTKGRKTNCPESCRIYLQRLHSDLGGERV